MRTGMKTELRALLTADAQLAALASGGVSWGVHPQGADAPYITLNLIAEQRSHSLGGPTGPRFAMVQVDCYAPSAAQADALAMRTEAVLDGFSGQGWQGIFLVAKRDLSGIEASAGAKNVSGGGENEVIHRVSLDFNMVRNA